jgi:hypothetical protein
VGGCAWWLSSGLALTIYSIHHHALLPLCVAHRAAVHA